ncbi:MAG: FAD binding domain-containing protein [Anaerolineae bacterium]|nr:FAD binding domain-containing protein [Anaerolineae bacterium]
MLRNLEAIHRPADLQEAVRLVQQTTAVPLGGGTQLLPASSPAVEAVVDLGRLGLTYVEVEMERVRVGATTSLQRFADDPAVQEMTQGIAGEAVRLVAARNIRGQATVGGMLAAGGGDHPLLAVLLVLEALLTLHAPELRTVAVDSLLSYRERMLGDGGLISELSIPRPAETAGWGMAHVGRTPRDRPIVFAVGRVVMTEGRCREVRLALSGVARRPVRLGQAEQHLCGAEPTPQRLEQAAGIAAAALAPPADFRGSSEYRREMAAVLARRALAQAVARY